MWSSMVSWVSFKLQRDIREFVIFGKAVRHPYTTSASLPGIVKRVASCSKKEEYRDERSDRYLVRLRPSCSVVIINRETPKIGRTSDLRCTTCSPWSASPTPSMNTTFACSFHKYLKRLLEFELVTRHSPNATLSKQPGSSS